MSVRAGFGKSNSVTNTDEYYYTATAKDYANAISKSVIPSANQSGNGDFTAQITAETSGILLSRLKSILNGNTATPLDYSD